MERETLLAFLAFAPKVQQQISAAPPWEKRPFHAKALKGRDNSADLFGPFRAFIIILAGTQGGCALPWAELLLHLRCEYKCATSKSASESRRKIPR